MKIKNIYCRIKILTAVVFSLCICFMAADIQAGDTSSSITVLLTNSKENICMKNTEVNIYKIAEFTDYGNREFVAEKQYEKIISGLDFSTVEKSCTMENAKIILDFIKKKQISVSMTKKTDKNGEVKFDKLTSGIYLVDVESDEKYSVDEFIVETPMFEEGIYKNDVLAEPKIEVINSDDKGIEETKPPVEYKEKLPQTGQLKWPVPVLCVLGISFIAFGYADYCFKERKKNENKQK